jgi:nicotinamide mononucleotide (NMN) deamidase PncC
VGLFYIGLADKDSCQARKHLFSGNRRQNREQAAEMAIRWLRDYLLSMARPR